MVTGSGVAQSAFNAIVNTAADGTTSGMTNDQYADLVALQTLTTQIIALQTKYSGM